MLLCRSRPGWWFPTSSSSVLNCFKARTTIKLTTRMTRDITPPSCSPHIWAQSAPWWRQGKLRMRLFSRILFFPTVLGEPSVHNRNKLIQDFPRVVCHRQHTLETRWTGINCLLIYVLHLCCLNLIWHRDGPVVLADRGMSFIRFIILSYPKSHQKFIGSIKRDCFGLKRVSKIN